MKRMGGTMVWLLAIVLYMQTQPFSKVIAAANNGQHKGSISIHHLLQLYVFKTHSVKSPTFFCLILSMKSVF